VIAAFVAAAVLAMLFVWREGRAVQPMLPLFLFSHRLFILTTIVGLLVNIAIYGLIFVLSLYFQRVAGLHASLVVSATVLLLAAAVIGIGVASRDQTM
jgi:DHA2 family methylenomycin A resistance protein-like MFS transporter